MRRGEGGEEGEGDSSFFCSNFSVFYRHRGFQPLSLFSFLQTRFNFNLSICIVCLSGSSFVRLSVCVQKRQNSWTNRAQICCGTSRGPGKVKKWSVFQKFASNKIWFSLNYWKFWNSTTFFWESANFFLLFHNVNKENIWNRRWVRKFLYVVLQYTEIYARITFIQKPQLKIISFQNNKNWYLTKLLRVLMNVNRALPSLHEG